MTRIQLALKTIQKAETQLRELLAEAASSASYDETVALADLAKRVSSILQELGAAPDRATPDSAVSPRRGAIDTGKNRAAPPKASGRTRAAGSSYPRFARDAKDLVKIGWSKSNKTEYEHRAPYEAVMALVRALTNVGTQGERFVMESVLPLSLPDGAEVPTYQAYVALAWLRSLGVIHQHGRQGYTIPRGSELTHLVESAWSATAKH